MRSAANVLYSSTVQYCSRVECRVSIGRVSTGRATRLVMAHNAHRDLNVGARGGWRRPPRARARCAARRTRERPPTRGSRRAARQLTPVSRERDSSCEKGPRCHSRPTRAFGDSTCAIYGRGSTRMQVTNRKDNLVLY